MRTTKQEQPQRSKRVGIWIRVSTEDQARGESPEHHEYRARHYAEAKEWSVVEVYHLEGVSGKGVMDHPETQRLLRDIERGHISGLIFSKLARLCRNIKELLGFAEYFRQHEAVLISLQESIDTSTPAGRLFYTLIAAMAQWEREEISERVAASVPIRAQLGKHLGGKAPFGYQWKDKRLVPDPQTAPIRRLVHELYLKHKRKNAVARILNKRGYKTQNGKAFTAAGIAVMLHDPTPKGLHRANYMTSSKRKGERLKSQDHWVYNPVEPIIDTDVWDACHRILTEQESQWHPRARTPVHPFAGLTICGRCGGKMYVPSNMPKYVCRKCRNKIPIVSLEEDFLERIRAYFFSPEAIRAYLEGADAEIQEKSELLKTLEQELGRLRQNKERVFRLYMDRAIETDGFRERYQPLEEREKQLNQEIPRLQGEIDYLRVNLTSGEDVFEQGQTLAEIWPSLELEDKQRAVESLVEQIVVGDTEIAITLYYLPMLMKEGMAQPIKNGSNDPNLTTDSNFQCSSQTPSPNKSSPHTSSKIASTSTTTHNDP